MLTLILVRHGETHLNAERYLQGSGSDVGLSPLGREQAERVAQALKGEELDAVYSSPLKRALETARAIATPHGLEVKVAPDLREVDAGELEGISLDELSRNYSELWEDWRWGSGSLRMPGGENLDDLQERAWAALERIVAAHSETAIVVVGHTFTNLVLICRALGLPPGFFRKMRQGLAAINVLRHDAIGWRLVSLNDRCHLEA